MRALPLRPRVASPRFAVISSPRSANTWLRRLLGQLFDLEEIPVHAPAEVPWGELPERCIVQLHWPRDPALVARLRRERFQICVLVRHPLDMLVSILHFCAHEPLTARWLDGAHGDEREIVGAEPCSAEFVRYAASPRARALVGVSPQWWNRHAVARLRFEDFVTDPADGLAKIVTDSRIAPVMAISETLRDLPFGRLQIETDNAHFWQGRVGLWRELLPAALAHQIAAPYVSHAQRFRYELAPDRSLDLEAARAHWRELARVPGRVS
ncbi:MAG TPA: hypothetical protein VHX88_02375 [Solirubrobacteraceae bacterium]|nr:hypothetical protein [Solirubrobacteraceae bacterium]